MGWFLLVFLMTEHWTLSIALARDFGTQGTLFDIAEEDPIQLIQKKLKILQDSGELERLTIELQQKAKISLERPRPVTGISRASRSRVFSFDPTYVVRQDLKDYKGQIIARRGTKINPLETVFLRSSLIFINGDDADQIKWAKDQTESNKVKLILVKGAPLELASTLKVPIYFDQGGYLSKRLGITHVPAIVTQEKNCLRIEEVNIKDET